MRTVKDNRIYFGAPLPKFVAYCRTAMEHPADMRLLTYCRVSTEEQAKEGVSLGAQRARLEQYAAALGHEIVEVIEDAGISGKSLKRPGLKRALKMLRTREADGLLITKLDRLTRTTRDMIELVDRYFATGKCALISLGESIDTGSAMGRMVLTFFATIAQWEREAIAERTREALRHKKANGARLGAVPLGFKRDGDSFVLDRAEQLVLKRAFDLEQQRRTLTQIAAALKSEGHKTKRGGKWHLTTVRKLLARAHLARELDGAQNPNDGGVELAEARDRKASDPDPATPSR